MLDFKSLVDRYAEEVTIYVANDESSSGYYDYENGGEWVDGIINPITEKAAVFQMGVKGLNSQNKIQYGEGGTYSIGDIKVYIHRQLSIGSKMSWRGKKFTISEELDYSSHTKDLYIYVCKRGEG